MGYFRQIYWQQDSIIINDFKRGLGHSVQPTFFSLLISACLYVSCSWIHFDTRITKFELKCLAYLDGTIKTLCTNLSLVTNLAWKKIFTVDLWISTSGTQKSHGWLVYSLNKTDKKAYVILKSQNYVNQNVKDYWKKPVCVFCCPTVKECQAGAFWCHEFL